MQIGPYLAIRSLCFAQPYNENIQSANKLRALKMNSLRNPLSTDTYIISEVLRVSGLFVIT